MHESDVVALPDAVADPRAMVVESFDAVVAVHAMLRTRGALHVARRAVPRELKRSKRTRGVRLHMRERDNERKSERTNERKSERTRENAAYFGISQVVVACASL